MEFLRDQYAGAGPCFVEGASSYMNEAAETEDLSRTYCVLFAIASGAAVSAGASAVGISVDFLVYVLMLMWSAIPFAISRTIFRSKERGWVVLTSYVVLCVMASILYPFGMFIPFLAWPVFHAVRGKQYSKKSKVTAEGNAVRPTSTVLGLGAAVALSLIVFAALTVVSLWWAGHGGREVGNEVSAFCASINVGDDPAGLDEKASVALNDNYTWSRMPTGEMELVVDKYSGFTRSICTVTAVGGKVTKKKRWGYAR